MGTIERKAFYSGNLSLPIPVLPCRYLHFRYLPLCYLDIVRGGRWSPKAWSPSSMAPIQSQFLLKCLIWLLIFIDLYSLLKNLFQFLIKIEMLLEEIFTKKKKQKNTAVNDWHQHEEKKKIPCQCFNTLLAEQLLLLSPSALNGCAQNWTCQQMVISTVWHASWCILRCWQMKYNSPGGMLWFLKQYLHNKKQKPTESSHWGPRSISSKVVLSCLFSRFEQQSSLLRD